MTTSGVLVTQTAAVGGRPPLDLLGGKNFCLCYCFLDFVGWSVDPSHCWIFQHLHCIVTDIKDPTKVVAMVEHVVERSEDDFLPLQTEEYFESKLSNSKCTPVFI